MSGVYHRVNDPPEVIQKIIASEELWGGPGRNVFQSDIPKVKAFAGPLPPDTAGFEFETDVIPDVGCVPGKPTWCNVPKRAGVFVEDDYAKIKIRLRKVTVPSM